MLADGFTNRKFRKARLTVIYWESEENWPARLDEDCGSGRRNKASKLKNGMDRLEEIVKESVKACAYCCKYQDGVGIGLERASWAAKPPGSSVKLARASPTRFRCLASGAGLSATRDAFELQHWAHQVGIERQNLPRNTGAQGQREINFSSTWESSLWGLGLE